MQKWDRKRVFKCEVCIWVLLVAFSCIWIAFGCIRLHWRLVQVALCCICAFSCILSSSWKQWSNCFYYFEWQSLSHQNHEDLSTSRTLIETKQYKLLVEHSYQDSRVFYFMPTDFNENVSTNTSWVSFFVYSKQWKHSAQQSKNKQVKWIKQTFIFWYITDFCWNYSCFLHQEDHG